MSGIKDVVERVMPVYCNWRMGKDKVYGVWGAGLKNCVMRNCFYDEDEKGIVNDVIYVEGMRLEPFTYRDAYIGGIGTGRDGVLWFGDKIIVEDYVDIGEVSWKWGVGYGSVRLLNGSWGDNIDMWRFDYEKLTEVDTGANLIDVGVVNAEDELVIDGLVEYGKELKVKEKFLKRVKVVVDESGIGDLGFKVNFDRGYVVYDEYMKRIYNVRVDNNRIIVEKGKHDVVYVDCWGVYESVVDDEWEVWCRGSNSSSDIGQKEWKKVRFGDRVEQNRYWQIRVRMYGRKRRGFYKVKSIVIRKYNYKMRL